jgi:hypothetical protein
MLLCLGLIAIPSDLCLGKAGQCLVMICGLWRMYVWVPKSDSGAGTRIVASELHEGRWRCISCARCGGLDGELGVRAVVEGGLVEVVAQQKQRHLPAPYAMMTVKASNKNRRIIAWLQKLYHCLE